MQLALTVGGLVLVGIVLLGLVGYLVDKTAEPEDRKK
jgi:preprotein translocase subunit Sss1